jgi:hypothetical protein
VGINCSPKPDAVSCFRYVLSALSGRQETHLEESKDDGLLGRETAAADMIREHRAKVDSVTAFANPKMNVGDATAVYLRKVSSNVSLKPRSKDYREMTVDFIRAASSTTSLRTRRALMTFSEM